MAPVVWGLDFKEMQWYKFKSSYMFGNTDYHLRRTKFVVYQCALIFCVISESLGTDLLSDYTDGQTHVQHLSNGRLNVTNNDYVAAASYNIFAGVFVATIFGAAFFFDLFWPARQESKSVRIAWKVCGVLSVLMYLASAILLTLITVTHRAHVRNATTHQVITHNENYWWNQYHKHSEAPLDYSKGARAIAAVVFAWLGWVSIVPSCVLLFLSIDNVEKGPGPKSRHARQADAANGAKDADMSEKGLQDPEQAHTNGTRTDGAAGYPPAAERTR